MRDSANIREIDNIGLADWMGFIFYPKSSRYVSSVPDYLPVNCRRVGVFVNATHKDIIARKEAFGLDIIQLHGNESRNYILQLKQLLPADTQIIKMIQVANINDLEDTREYENLVSYFLFETKCTEYGGSGRQFDWDILKEYNGSTPFLLTGGITPEDAERVKSFTHPMFAGIDINSKFETSPAVKDTKLVQEFLASINR